MTTDQASLDGIPPPPFTVEVGITGSDRWNGLTEAEFEKLAIGKVYVLTIEAHITTKGTHEKGDDEVPFIKLKADWIDTDERSHDALRSAKPDDV